MNETSTNPSSRPNWFWYIFIASIILLLPWTYFLVPLENRVAIKLRLQGFKIIHNPRGVTWRWYCPTHFGNYQFRQYPEVTDEVLAELQKMPHLFSVSFGDTDLSQINLELLTKVPALEHFQVLNNTDPAWSPKDINKLSGCLRLRNIMLMKVPLTNKEIEPLKACPITHLSFISAGLTDADSAVFTLFPTLETLQLRDNPGITDSSLAIFETISSLRYLSVQGTGVTQEGVEAFQNKRPDVKLRTDWVDNFGWGP